MRQGSSVSAGSATDKFWGSREHGFKDGEGTCGSARHGTFEMPIDATVITTFNVVFSLGSFLFGVVLRSMQMLVLRAAQGGDGGGEGDGAENLLVGPRSITLQQQEAQKV